jgi:hypothetical protein
VPYMVGINALPQSNDSMPKRHRGNSKPSLLCTSQTPLSLPCWTVAPLVRRGERAGSLESTLNGWEGRQRRWVRWGGLMVHVTVGVYESD